MPDERIDQYLDDYDRRPAELLATLDAMSNDELAAWYAAQEDESDE